MDQRPEQTELKELHELMDQNQQSIAQIRAMIHKLEALLAALGSERVKEEDTVDAGR